MKTNFVRTTTILCLVILMPIILSGFKGMKKYSADKSDWHYILALVGSGILSLVFIAGLIFLFYSFFSPKKSE